MLTLLIGRPVFAPMLTTLIQRLIFVLPLAGSLPLHGAAEPLFNYAEALQKSLYFIEAQQNGPLSPNNRVAWRGPSGLTDGKDLGRDLAGGWFDAGDHWTANLTMSFAAMSLAWSAVEQPEGWVKTGQMDELLESLIYVNQYFVKCVLNPDCADPARELEVVIGCGGREGVEPPAVHAMWSGAELAHLMTNRPTFRLNKQAPGGDIPAAMAAAMTASAMVIRDHAAVLKGMRGYEKFDAPAFVATLLDRAEKLTLFAKANMGPMLPDKGTEAEKAAIRKQRTQALRGDGKIVEIGYRCQPAPQVFAAATWLARATPAGPERERWVALAEEIYEGPYKGENYHDWWQDSGLTNFGRIGALNMLRLNPATEKYHAELQYYVVRFTDYKTTPGGLRLREWHSHEYGSLRHANNAAAIALYYSDLVEQAPVLAGNTWWKGAKTNAELKTLFIREAQRQVDYALGANPYGRSYLVGFGKQPFNHSHHRGAFGAWAGFEHFIAGKPEFRREARHILYGALIAGPDHNDVFMCGKENLPYLLLEDGKTRDFFYKFPNREKPVRKEGYVFDPADQPVQDVMDSQFNEVALDYNGGFTANLAWLCAHGRSAGQALPDSAFPPRDERNESLDLRTTDREFFVSAKVIADTADGTEIEARIWNRSRWPSRATDQLSFRYYFTHAGEVTATLTDGGQAKVSAAQTAAGGQRYIEVSWPGEVLHPSNHETNSRRVRLKLAALSWNAGDDWAHATLDPESRIAPRLPVYQAAKKLSGEEPE